MFISFMLVLHDFLFDVNAYQMSFIQELNTRLENPLSDPIFEC
jgi:hypothetical protein